MKTPTRFLRLTMALAIILVSSALQAQVAHSQKGDLPAAEGPLQLKRNQRQISSDSTQTFQTGNENQIGSPTDFQQTTTIVSAPNIESARVLTRKLLETAIKGPKAPVNPAKAAPANDDICSARSIPAPLNGNCLTSQTNIDATGDYYGGCVPVDASSVWYTFTLTGSNDQIDITFTVPGGLGAPSLGQGNNIFLFLMSGTCAAPNGIETQCNTASTTFHFDHLTPGGTYFLEVATTSASTGNFNICATQSVMPVGSQVGPEQDCAGAIPLCSGFYSYTGSYYDHGSIQDVSTSSCLLSGETNSIWYVFTCQTAGTFGFDIATTKDYDFALYDLTTIGGCSNVPSSIPIRCNFSATYGNTGLTIPGATEAPSQSVSASGLPTMDGISNMAAGRTYALIIDNWTGDNTGFDITFLGTASIVDNTRPTMTSIAPSCTDNTILITMSEPVQCLSVQENDFSVILLPGTDVTSKVTQILGFNCPTTSGALTNQLQITHDGTLSTGQYQIVVGANPSLADKCGNKILPGSTINFNYLAPITLTPSQASICNGSSVNLNADGADGGLVTYTLNPGGLTNSTNGVFTGLTPTITTNYNVTATYGGCTRTATTTVNVEGNIITTISPGSTTVCSFAPPVVLNASTTINGVACGSCTYVWSTGATTSSISVAAAGTYTVTVTTGSGCHNGNSPSTTLSLASAGTGGGSCDVIYVSPAGGGDGYTKGSPTTLADAITKAQCTYTVIKMQRGIYSLSDYQNIHSFATIEGGYDATFSTKYSDMTGGTNTTTIRRSNAADSDNANTCTAFRVDDGAINFRIQDVRIELPGANPLASNPGHAAASNKTNYGIKLGAGCSAYNIVRCYIDAGVGSAP